jgi:hypothetical protein
MVVEIGGGARERVARPSDTSALRKFGSVMVVYGLNAELASESKEKE